MLQPRVFSACPETLDSWVDSLLATAPPLSPAQRNTIAAAFGAAPAAEDAA